MTYFRCPQEPNPNLTYHDIMLYATIPQKNTWMCVNIWNIVTIGRTEHIWAIATYTGSHKSNYIRKNTLRLRKYEKGNFILMVMQIKLRMLYYSTGARISFFLHPLQFLSKGFFRKVIGYIWSTLEQPLILIISFYLINKSIFCTPITIKNQLII